MPLRGMEGNSSVCFRHIMNSALGARGRFDSARATMEKVLYGEGKLSGSTRELIEGTG